VRPIANKAARRLDDGRVVFTCTVGEFSWQCVCAAADGHDHIGVVQQFAQNLAKYDAAVATLPSYVGLTGTLRGATYTIQTASIAVFAAGLFRFTATVLAAPVDGLAPSKLLTVTIDYTDPSRITLSDVIASFMNAIGAHGDAHVGAAQMVTTFLS
jgi:hypothetical protein